MSLARGKRFTFTPKQGWSTSTKSPLKGDNVTASTTLTPPPPTTSACPAALLSISPTIGFESSNRAALPALISPRAHVSLTRCTSAPPTTPSPHSKRQRQYSDSEEDERWSYAAASECRRGVEAEVEVESADSELFAITSRPLSILVSPLCIRERPHCPPPPSPANSDVVSLSSHSSASTAPSPRRPLFVNHIVAAADNQRRTSPRLTAATSRPSTAPSLSTDSLSSVSMPPLTSFSLSTHSTPSTPLSSAYTASTALTTPSSSHTASSATPSSPPLTADCRTRSQWRRFRLGATTATTTASDEPSTDVLRTTRRAVPRRIIPTLMYDAEKATPTLPCAPTEGRSQSTGSGRLLTSPKRSHSVSFPSSPPAAPSSKRHRSVAVRVGGDNSKSQSMKRSRGGEQTSMHDYLLAVM